MRRRGVLIGLLLALTAAPAASQPQQPVPQTCDTLESCVAALIAQSRTGRQANETIRNRLRTLGDAAISALIPLLMHDDLYVRESAGLTLIGFERIDPRYLPTLVHAWRYGETGYRRGHGNGWMPVPMAATGTDEALALLWADFLRDPEHGSNSQTFFALARFGERLRPLVRAQLETCSSVWTPACDGILSLFWELDRRWPPPRPPVLPAWALDELVTLSRAESREARDNAVDRLAQLRHPAALEPLQRRLASSQPDAAQSEGGSWEVRGLIGQIEQYGEAARASGPVIVQYLRAERNPDLRADAALALGRIGDTSAAAALLDLVPRFRDDWLLAYNATESLGRIRAVAARPILEDVARTHWHRGVRNNAERALNMISGGGFARPNVAGDGREYPAPRDDNGEEYLYFGGLRYAGDDQPKGCTPTRDRRFETHPVGSISWPASGIEHLEFVGVGAEAAREFRDRIPIEDIRGAIVAIAPTRAGWLIAFNGGEFGGGVYYLPQRGRGLRLTGEPVAAMWRAGGRLFVAAGLAHLVLDVGHVYVIDPDGPTVERIIRLPASPRRILVSAERVVFVETQAGALTVRTDGSPASPELGVGC